MNAGASLSAVPSPIEGSGTAWVLLGSWALSPARPTPIHPRHECRGLSALFGEAEVKGGAGAPTEATVDITLRRQFNGMGRKFIVRQPPARVLGKRRAEGVSVVLIESMGMGD